MEAQERGRPTRRRFLAGGVAGTAAAVAFGALPAGALAGVLSSPGIVPLGRACCPPRIRPPARLRQIALADLAEGNRQAVAVARRSAFVARATDRLLALAEALPDAALRAGTLDLLRNPAPTYQRHSPTATDRAVVRHELLEAGLIPESTTIEGIFPPVADPAQAPQPLWAAPGSSFQAHHAYPGGLVVHEWFNAMLAERYAEAYETLYGLDGPPPVLDPSILVGAPLWHDVHKVSVFQWQPDGSELAEQIIADTGAHHTLGGAEALVRGLPAPFVVAQLSAHDAPTTVQVRPDQTGRQRLVNYLHAAAIVARVDPVTVGLLRRTPDDGYALADEPPRFEGYLNHFADQDWLLTNDAVAATVAALRTLADVYGIDAQRQPARFNLFRNLVLSQLSELRLYATLAAGGAPAVRALVDAEVDLAQLRA